MIFLLEVDGTISEVRVIREVVKAKTPRCYEVEREENDFFFVELDSNEDIQKLNGHSVYGDIWVPVYIYKNKQKNYRDATIKIKK